jgi:hypothetical protein
MSSAMSMAAPAQKAASKPRQAATSSVSGECEACSNKKLVGLQTKLRINEPGDAYEQEADRVANQVLARPVQPGVTSTPLRIQRYAGQSTGGANTAPASVNHVLASSGRPLEPALRQEMEQRFGHDFSRVRVHTGGAAEQSTRDVNAHAYTVGHNMVFGADQFAPRTNEGRRLIAHELTHVVQQSGLDGIPGGRDKHRRSVQTRVPTENVLQAQPAKPKEADWEPEVEAETRSAHVEVGKTVSLKFRVSNERTAPKGTTFDWRGIRLDESETITMVGFSDHVGAHASLVVKGRADGISEVGTTVYFKVPGGQEDYEHTPRVRVQVGPEIAAAQAELSRIEKSRAEGKEVSPSRELAAQQEAGAAAQKALGKARGAAGGEINQILTNVRGDIQRIESARYRGYQDALIHLNLTQFDEKEQAGNVKSFVLSLIGNLTWALSGLIAITPFGLEAALAAGLIAKIGEAEAAARLASRLAQLETIRRARLATGVGVAGAMLAQFANGLPSGPSGGGEVSSPLIELQKKLNEFNASVFNTLSRDLYATLLRLVDITPPDPDVDAQQYAGRLENGIRHLLFGGYYENGGASGAQINPSVIQDDARNQLLRRLVIGTGKISKDKVVSTRLEKRGVGKLVEPAVALVGGAKALQLKDYELVAAQLQRVTRELAIEGLPKVESEELRTGFAQRNIIAFPTRVTDGGIAISNVVRALYLDRDMLEIDPGAVHPWVTQVLHVEIRKKDLTSAKIGKEHALVYSADKLWIRALGYLGAAHMEDEYEQVQQGPVPLWLIFKV